MQKISAAFKIVSQLLIIIKNYNFALLRSAYFCFKYLPFKQAIKIPIFISNNTKVLINGGGIIRITGPIQLGMIKIGFTQARFFLSSQNPSIIDIDAGIIEFHGYANIGSGCKISVCNGGYLGVGSQFWSTGPISIIARKKIVLDYDCVCSWNITLMDHDAHNIYIDDKCINEPSEIHIKDHCWIGFNSMILKGVHLEPNTVIGAGSIVTRTCDVSNVVIVGTPAKIKKTNVVWGN